MKFTVIAKIKGEEVFRVRASEQTIQGMVGQAVWVALEDARERPSGQLVNPPTIDIQVTPIAE